MLRLVRPTVAAAGSTLVKINTKIVRRCVMQSREVT